MAVRWSVSPSGFIVIVFCDSCMRYAPARGGCRLCGAEQLRLRWLLDDDEFRALQRSVTELPGDRLRWLVAADWLDERGYDELADLFRDAP